MRTPIAPPPAAAPSPAPAAGLVLALAAALTATAIAGCGRGGKNGARERVAVESRPSGPAAEPAAGQAAPAAPAGQAAPAAPAVPAAPPVESEPPNAASQRPAFPGQTRAPRRSEGFELEVTRIAGELERPWALAFLPDGRMLVTERPGRMRVLGRDGSRSAPVSGLPQVDARGQGGLLDVLLDPGFARNGTVYWSFAEPRGGGTNATAVARGRLDLAGAAPAMRDVRVIWRQEPAWASVLHFGSRLVLARDGTLLVGLGERSVRDARAIAQRLDNTLGKVVRIRTDGTIPADNPLAGRAGARPEIYSWGHRNIQAAALHPDTGKLWVVEHGALGGDEINVVSPGKNYGWPVITYGLEYSRAPIGEGITAAPSLEQPIYYWDPVIAPSGMAFITGDTFPGWRGSLVIGGLAGQHLARVVLDGERVVGEERLLEGRARFRDVRQGPDGALYVLTDERDGELLRLAPRRPAR